jgi:hypothetical protein
MVCSLCAKSGSGTSDRTGNGFEQHFAMDFVVLDQAKSGMSRCAGESFSMVSGRRTLRVEGQAISCQTSDLVTLRRFTVNVQVIQHVVAVNHVLESQTRFGKVERTPTQAMVKRFTVDLGKSRTVGLVV